MQNRKNRTDCEWVTFCKVHGNRYRFALLLRRRRKWSSYLFRLQFFLSVSRLLNYYCEYIEKAREKERETEKRIRTKISIDGGASACYDICNNEYSIKLRQKRKKFVSINNQQWQEENEPEAHSIRIAATKTSSMHTDYDNRNETTNR